MKRNNFVLAGMLLIFAVSCVAPEEWSDKYENVAPDDVSNIQVENVNGGAIISYTLPSNVSKKDLVGAKVTYSLTTDGELLERWSSVEKDTIELEGYGDTSERTVTLYAAHKNGLLSQGVQVSINPLTPLIVVMRETMVVSSTFGGIQITWDNPTRKDMGIALYTEDSITHEMTLYDKYFSNGILGKTAFRPFESEEQRFRIEMFDRWQNFAQPLDTLLTPLNEVVIQGRDERGNPIWSLFDDEGTVNGLNRYYYRCDKHNINATYNFTRVIAWPGGSGVTTLWYPDSRGDFEKYFPGQVVGSVMPYPWYVTFDMGREAIYSRMGIFSYQRSPVYSATVPVEFNVWGTNNPKRVEDVEDPHGIHPKGSREANQAYWSSWTEANGTDAWKNDGWVKLATCKYMLSSGDNKYYADIPLSAEDVYAYQNGYEYEFNEGVTEAYRYLRWEILSTNTDIRELYLSGLRYFGSYPE